YRRFLAYVHWRWQRNRFEPEHKHAYSTADEFAADLRIVRESLAANGAERIAQRLLDPLLRQIGTFGFYLHTLDIRQHARLHKKAVEEFGGALNEDESHASAESSEISAQSREVAA